MDKIALTKKVKDMAYALGADMVGIAPVSRFDGQPHMLHPSAHLPEARSVICFGIHHPDASVEWCGEPNPNYPEAFQIGMIPKLDTMCHRIAKMLEGEGYPTIAQPCTTYWRHRKYKDIPYEHAATFSHMAAFVACGLGEYGYHGMVMSPEYGPRERIISIITSADLEPTPLYDGPALCDGCHLCARVCIGKNYDEEKLNDPKFIEFTIEGKTFRYPNINRWRCFYGEQAHLDTTKLGDFVEMDEAGIYDAIETVPRVANHGYMCKSFKYCMTPGKRYFKRSYAPGALRKKEKADTSLEEMMSTICRMAVENGADCVTVTPLSDYVDLKPNFEEGFRTEQFFEHFTTVVTFGRSLHRYGKGNAFEDRNALHVVRPTTDRMTSGLIDVTRYLDDLGYDAIQDWTFTKISPTAAKRAGWCEEGREVYSVSVICNIPFKHETRSLLSWSEISPDTFRAGEGILANVEYMAVGDTEGITYPAFAAVREAYPWARSIVALASAIPERTVELACRQEAEDGGPYAFMHYEILKECLWAGEDLCSSLEAHGYRAITLPDLAPDSYLTVGKLGRHMPDLAANAPFAAAAGLGTVGKSGMLTRPDVGPRLRYVFVLTDAPLTPTERVTVACPADCTACATACPMQALSPDRKEQIEIRKGEVYTVLTRDETRCMWARSLALCEGAGSAQLGWQIPDIPVPKSVTPADIDAALAAKDKLQTLAYQCPNFTDIIIERCLQDCPLGKKK